MDSRLRGNDRKEKTKTKKKKKKEKKWIPAFAGMTRKRKQKNIKTSD